MFAPDALRDLDLTPRTIRLTVSSGPMAPIRVAVVDDHELLLESLARRLGDFDDIRVVATYCSLAECVDGLTHREVDVVLADLRIGQDLGTDLVCRTDAPVLVMSGGDIDEGVRAATIAGCGGYVSKERPVAAVADAIRLVASGALSFPRDAWRSHQNRDLTVPGASLTPREMEVLELMARGRSASEIADELQVSRHTVRNHVAAVLGKLGARSQLEAVVMAFEHRLVSLQGG